MLERIKNILTGKTIKHKYKTFVYKHDWNCLIWEKAKLRYHDVTGQRLNYSKPDNLNEKLMWLERYWRHPLKTICSDKFLVRNYLNNLGLEELSIPLLGVYNNANEIDFNLLPEKFVLKCNHGSGYNIICTDKKLLDREKTIFLLNKWIKQDFGKKFSEIHYSTIDRKIICELLISDNAPIEYQFWCINGQPESLLVCRKNFDDTYDAGSFSLDWKQLYDRIGEKCVNFSRPVNLSKMICFSKRLSEPFPFVRVDFYEVNGKLFLAELTFSPSANILSNYKDEFIVNMGKKLILPHPWKNN